MSSTKIAPVDQISNGGSRCGDTLARRAAPESVSGDAEVMVLARHGYEVEVAVQTFLCVW